jgi:hypothetical protein
MAALRVSSHRQILARVSVNCSPASSSILQPEHFRPADGILLARYVESAALAETAAHELRKGAVIDGKASPWLVIQEKAIRAMTALSGR